MAIIIVASFPKVATWLPQHVISSEAPRKGSGHSKI
jgi:hypothetical protein